MKQRRKVKGQRKRGGTFLEEGNWEKRTMMKPLPPRSQRFSFLCLYTVQV